MVDLTAINDDKHWRAVSGRAIVIVMGDRGEIRAGQAIEAIGQLAKIPGPLNPGEFDYRGFLRGQGIDLRLTVDDPDGTRTIRMVGPRHLSRTGKSPRLEPGSTGRSSGPRGSSR